MKKLLFFLILITVLALPASVLAGPDDAGQPPWAQWPGCPGNAPHCKGPHNGW